MYNGGMNQRENIKRIALITVAMVASGYFLYSGFTLLFSAP